MALIICVTLVVVLIFMYKLLTRKNDYFERKGIPYRKAYPIIGSRSDMILRNKSFPDVIMDWYTEFPDDK